MYIYIHAHTNIHTDIHTVLRPARSVLSAGLAARSWWRVVVAANPRSNGSDIDGIMLRVYSTPMKNNSDAAKTQGTGWWRGNANASAAVHFRKWASPT